MGAWLGRFSLVSVFVERGHQPIPVWVGAALFIGVSPLAITGDFTPGVAGFAVNPGGRKAWIQSPAGDGRWGFVGEPADMEAQLRYVGRQVPREFRTSRNPIRFVAENEFPPPIVYGPEE